MESPKINVVLTADYELFLGRNYFDHDQVLFEPTRQLLATCDALDVPMTLFADVCSAWAHRDSGQSDYVTKFESQLKEAVSRNHDVQLHLHPHWMFSQFENGEWVLSTDKMYLSELDEQHEVTSASGLIQTGKSYLTELLTAANNSYRCCAFRAAGLALQPNEKGLIAQLIDHGIEIDSSIASGLKVKTDTITIDYTNTPDLPNWRLNPQSGITEDGGSGLLEIPIASFKCSFAQRTGFLLRRAASVGMQRGSSISRSAKQTRLSTLKNLIKYNLRYVLANPWFMLSCDTKGLNLDMLVRGFDSYITRFPNHSEISLSMINHPKLMFPPQMELLRDFCETIRDKYGEKLRFVTYGDLIEKRHSNS